MKKRLFNILIFLFITFSVVAQDVQWNGFTKDYSGYKFKTFQNRSGSYALDTTTDATIDSVQKGEMWWNNAENTISIKKSGGVINIGEEFDPLSIHTADTNIVAVTPHYLDSTINSIPSSGLKSWYFTNDASDIVGMYMAQDTLPTDPLQTITSIATDDQSVVATFITPIKQYKVSEGNRFFYLNAKVSDASKDVQLRGNIYRCDTLGFHRVLLRSSTLTTNLTESMSLYTTNVYGNSLLIADTSRIIFEIVAVKGNSTGSDPTISLYVCDNTFTRLDVPVPSLALSQVVQDTIIDGVIDIAPSENAVNDALALKQNLLTNPVTGTGTSNYLSKFTNALAVVNSAIYNTGTLVGINTTNITRTLTIEGVQPQVIIRNNNTNLTAKYMSINSAQFKNTAESEGFTLLAAGSPDSSSNIVAYGGYLLEGNAATEQRFYTAENTTTRGGAIRMTINSIGNVGIGTLLPFGKLDVTSLLTNTDLYLKCYSLTSNTSGFFRFYKSHANSESNGITVNGEDLGRIMWSGNSGSGFTPAAIIKCVQNGTAGTNTPSDLFFYTTTATTNTANLVVKSNGKTGIGTIAPDGVLEVNLGTTGDVRYVYNDPDGSADNYTKFTINSSGNLGITSASSKPNNVGIGTLIPMSKLAILVSASTNLNGLNIVNSDINKGRINFQTSTDSASASISSSATGSLTMKITGKDGTIQFNNDSISTTVSGTLIAPKIRLTLEGGYAIKLINKTGVNSVKGTVVIADPAVDNAFEINPTGGEMPIGVVYESGIADGQECWVIVDGIAEVLLVDGQTSTRSYVCISSASVAGRMDISATVPSATTHFTEIGHTLENKSSGTNVLCKIVTHFN